MKCCKTFVANSTDVKLLLFHSVIIQVILEARFRDNFLTNGTKASPGNVLDDLRGELVLGTLKRFENKHFHFYLNRMALLN